MKLYYTSNKYIEYLSHYDKNVLFNKSGKRPYIGVLLEISNTKFFAPLSSPKEKHKTMQETIDLVKIRNGNRGVINLNNMIPVCETQLEQVNTDKISNLKYRQILIDQIRFINSNEKKIIQKAKVTFKIATSETLTESEIKIKKRCCNFKILITKSQEYDIIRSQSRLIII